MNCFVFDASTIINLNDIGLLPCMLSIKDKKYISDVTLQELSTYSLRETIRKNMVVYESHNDDFITFRENLKRRGISHSKQDLYIIYTIAKLSKEKNKKIYVITFDATLLKILKKYKIQFNKTHLEIWTTIDLLDYLLLNHTIDFLTFFEKTMEMFKSNEIHKYITSYKKHPNLYNNDITQIEEALKERFEVYEKQWIENINQILKGVKT